MKRINHAMLVLMVAIFVIGCGGGDTAPTPAPVATTAPAPTATAKPVPTATATAKPTATVPQPTATAPPTAAHEPTFQPPPTATPDMMSMMADMMTATPDMMSMMADMMAGMGKPTATVPQPTATHELTFQPPPTATPDMMSMMADMMAGMGGMGGMGKFAQTGQVPKLKNLMLQNLGPWDQASATFGDLKYDVRFGNTVFDDFGMLHNQGQSNQYDNPTFEFKAPADSVVLAPISGVVSMLEWQPSAAYTQDDWEIIIAPSQGSQWGINLDHVVSIDCDRSGNTPVLCELPLTINGEIVTLGTEIEAGQVLGYVGNWSSYDNTGINGRTELTVFKYFDDYSGVTNYCPTMYLDESVESIIKASIQELMDSYEAWSGDNSSYNQDQMVSPGCRYSAIKEVNGITEPVID